MTRVQKQTWGASAIAVIAHVIAFLALRTVPVPNDTPIPLGLTATSRPFVTLSPIPTASPPLEDVDALGEATGTGDSIARVDLPDVSQSDRPEDFEQAWTRQKPVFTAPLPGRTAAEHLAQARATKDERPGSGPASLIGLQSFAVPPAARVAGQAKPAEAIESSDAKPAGAAAPDAKGTPDPAVAGPSDLDAFAKQEGVSFAPGGIAARQGREARLVRPRIDLAFLADGTRLGGRELSVRVRVETDEAGRPRSVVLIESSGSDVIDDAVRLAIYDSWFGGRMPDAFPFTVTFR